MDTQVATRRSERLAELGQQLRVDSVRASAAAGSGHPTSSMSAADLMAVLLDGHLRYDFSDPANPMNDHLIFSKGHASPLLYSVFRAAGVIDERELLSFRKFGSRLEGHPTPRLPWVDVATGSLGQGLPIGVGVATAGRYLDRLPYRVWVLCGDSELAEGSIWEAFEEASFLQLDRLIAILDINRLGQTTPTRHGWDLDAYNRRLRAFGWNTIEVDGHDVRAIDEAYTEAERTEGRPTAIIARTIKGKGVRSVENVEGMHGRPLPNPDEAIAELGGVRKLVISVLDPPAGAPHRFPAGEGERPRFELGEKVATRKAYGQALEALGEARADVVALDGEVSNSTYSEMFAKELPDRYFEMYIAEEQMVAAAVGMQVRGWRPFASTFAAFMTRAYDFIRMAAYSRADIRLVGSHAGVSIGEDGPSQMGLEDMAALRAVHGSTVLHPCDANQTVALVDEMADQAGVVYLRTLRGATPVIYEPGTPMPIGGSRLLRSGEDDQVTIVAAGVTVHEALEAADRLAERGIGARVLDCYSVKPIDAIALREAADATGQRIVTVEDHWPQGGLGDAVLDAFADGRAVPRVVKLAVSGMPGSGKPAELLHAAGIDAEAITDAAEALVKAARG